MVEPRQSTGNDVTQSSQANSPRRLTKQSAFESPNDVQTNILNSISNAISLGQKNGQTITQRQRLRKTGPFVVDSQSVPDNRIKYAGSWAPPPYEPEADTKKAPQNGPNGHKPVTFHGHFTDFSAIHFSFLPLDTISIRTDVSRTIGQQQ